MTPTPSVWTASVACRLATSTGLRRRCSPPSSTSPPASKTAWCSRRCALDSPPEVEYIRSTLQSSRLLAQACLPTCPARWRRFARSSGAATRPLPWPSPMLTAGAPPLPPSFSVVPCFLRLLTRVLRSWVCVLRRVHGSGTAFGASNPPSRYKARHPNLCISLEIHLDTTHST